MVACAMASNPNPWAMYNSEGNQHEIARNELARRRRLVEGYAGGSSGGGAGAARRAYAGVYRQPSVRRSDSAGGGIARRSRAVSAVAMARKFRPSPGFFRNG